LELPEPAIIGFELLDPAIIGWEPECPSTGFMEDLVPVWPDSGFR